MTQAEPLYIVKRDMAPTVHGQTVRLKGGQFLTDFGIINELLANGCTDIQRLDQAYSIVDCQRCGHKNVAFEKPQPMAVVETTPVKQVKKLAAG